MFTINILDFTLDNPILEIILRTLAVYVFMILAIRLFGKKELAQLSVIDLVFILLISNSVQNAMVGPDSTLSGGLIAAGSLFLANFTLKRLFYRSKFFSKMVQGESLLLIYEGVANLENCEKAEITIDELDPIATPIYFQVLHLQTFTTSLSLFCHKRKKWEINCHKRFIHNA
jgi:hypothetical protein